MKSMKDCLARWLNRALIAAGILCLAAPGASAGAITLYYPPGFDAGEAKAITEALAQGSNPCIAGGRRGHQHDRSARGDRAEGQRGIGIGPVDQ